MYMYQYLIYLMVCGHLIICDDAGIRLQICGM